MLSDWFMEQMAQSRRRDACHAAAAAAIRELRAHDTGLRRVMPESSWNKLQFDIRHQITKLAGLD